MAPQALKLNATLMGTEKMLRRVIGEDVRLLTRLGEGVSSVKADPSQLEQVILNLAVNARDAMPTGGQLRHRGQHARARHGLSRLPAAGRRCRAGARVRARLPAGGRGDGDDSSGGG
jgi:two-component system cell cycle sensor histidine kinase/response regulator CckA